MSATAPTVQEAKVTNIDVPWLSLVVHADSEFARLKHRDIEYEFSGSATGFREFYADPTARGAYAHRLQLAQLNAFQATPAAFQRK